MYWYWQYQFESCFINLQHSQWFTHSSKRYLLLYFIRLSSLNLPPLLTKSALASCFSMSSNRNLASHIGHYCWLELLEQAGVNILNFSKIINTHQLELTSKQSKGQILYLLSSQEYNKLNEKKTQNLLRNSTSNGLPYMVIHNILIS